VVIVFDSARVGGVSHPLVKLGAELFLRCRVVGAVGHVVDLVRVLAEVVKLFGWPFREAELEELLHPRLVPMVEETPACG
jgi:hypothetical protein